MITINEGDSHATTMADDITVTGLTEKPWTNTEIKNHYRGDAPISINLEGASHDMSTTVTGEKIDHLILRDLDPKLTYEHNFLVLADVGSLFVESHGRVINTGGNGIRSITSLVDEGLTIENYGIIEEINGHKAARILNDGEINGIADTDELTNKEHGIIRTGEIESSTVTTRLTNYGTIEITEHGLTVGDENGSTLTNYGKINGVKGETLIADDKGGSSIVNYGTIAGDRGSEHGYFPGTILIGIHDTVENEIKNIGTIRGGTIAITGLPEGKDGQLRITNEGTIEGDIVTTVANDGGLTVGAEISLNNNVGGVWAAGMKGWHLNEEEFLYNKFKNVTNQGLIKTLNDSRPGRSTITAASFMNDGKIDVTAGGLTIIGDYTAGANSSLVTAAALMGDETELPTLVINGSVSGETTKVDVVNLGGTGAATVDGILVVRADTVDGEGFTKGERIVAGAYDYDLVKV
ncbi:hypothetical protein OD099_005313, partial [Salmonella enterica]|nr:hypothetical protein [Salmonella enterica]